MEARIAISNREETYRIFVTESLRLVPQNKYLGKRYIETIDAPQKHDSADGKAIVNDIMSRAGLKFKE